MAAAAYSLLGQAAPDFALRSVGGDNVRLSEHRGEVVHAVLTLIRAWFNADRPMFTARTKGSYEEYMGIVGGVLDVAGLSEVDWYADGPASVRYVNDTAHLRDLSSR